LRGENVEAAGEDAETIEHDAFLVGEQRIRPIDHRAQRLVTFHGLAPPTGEEPEPLIQQTADLRGRHRHHARGREFDRQRDPVQTAADLGDRRRVGRVESERRLRRFGSFGEQRHRLTRRDVGRGRFGNRQ
jgi:hypothetical protein